jgi:hypothetical protein
MKRKNFKVMWEMDIDAESEIEAAKEVLSIHRDPESIATIFTVYNPNGTYKVIDLLAKPYVVKRSKKRRK